MGARAASKRKRNANIRQTKRRKQRGGGDFFITPPLTPDITNPDDLSKHMNLFYISAHGQCDTDEYVMVPPNTFLLFTSEAGTVTKHFWGSQKEWLQTTPDYWEKVFRALYKTEKTGDILSNARIQASIQEMRVNATMGRGEESRQKRQIYFPGDIIPNTLISFNSTSHFKPLGIYDLPLQDPDIVSVWDLKGGFGNQTNLYWTAVDMFSKGFLVNDDLVVGRFKNRDAEASFREEASLPPVGRILGEKTLESVFEDPEAIKAAMDMWCQTRPLNYLSSIPDAKVKSPLKMEIPLSSILSNLKSHDPKQYKFLIAPVCRQTFEYRFGNNGVGKQSTRLVRRMSMCASGMCAAPDQPILNISKLIQLLHIAMDPRIRPPSEYFKKSNPFALQIAFIDGLARGHSMKSTNFANFLSVSSLPPEESASEPLQAFQEAVRTTFRPLRLALREEFPRSPVSGAREPAAPSSLRFFEATGLQRKLPPGASLEKVLRENLLPAAAEYEEAEARKYTNAKIAYRQKLEQTAMNVSQYFKDQVSQFKRQFKKFFDTLERLDTIDEIDAQKAKVQTLYNEFYIWKENIETEFGSSPTNLDASYKEKVQLELDKDRHAIYTLYTLYIEKEKEAKVNIYKIEFPELYASKQEQIQSVLEQIDRIVSGTIFERKRKLKEVEHEWNEKLEELEKEEDQSKQAEFFMTEQLLQPVFQRIREEVNRIPNGVDSILNIQYFINNTIVPMFTRYISQKPSLDYIRMIHEHREAIQEYTLQLDTLPPEDSVDIEDPITETINTLQKYEYLLYIEDLLQRSFLFLEESQKQKQKQNNMYHHGNLDTVLDKLRETQEALSKEPPGVFEGFDTFIKSIETRLETRIAHLYVEKMRHAGISFGGRRSVGRKRNTRRKHRFHSQ